MVAREVDLRCPGLCGAFTLLLLWHCGSLGAIFGHRNVCIGLMRQRDHFKTYARYRHSLSSTFWPLYETYNIPDLSLHSRILASTVPESWFMISMPISNINLGVVSLLMLLLRVFSSPLLQLLQRLVLAIIKRMAIRGDLCPRPALVSHNPVIQILE